MLRSTKDLDNFAIGATDGPIGHVKDFYFDDDAWAIRYLVVETGSWLNSRRVLISPMSLRHPDWAGRLLPVSITQAQVKNSPDVDANQPVSRQHELDTLGYYGYPAYWEGVGLWGDGLYPYPLQPDYPGYGLDQAERERAEADYSRLERARHRNDDPHLRSCNAVTGYHIHATDGEIGHVEGYLVDDATWAVRYLIVNTSNWWLGHAVLVAPQWIHAVHWSDESVSVGLTREAIQNAPVYESSVALTRAREAELYEHYGRSAYWAGGLPASTER